MTGRVDLALVSRTVQRLLEQSGRTILYDCRASKRTLQYSPESAAAVDGLLPAFLSAADAVWREATGRSLGIDIVADPETIFGFAVRGIHGGTFATVMLAVIDAIEQVSRPGVLLVNDLGRVWNETEFRIAASHVQGVA